ncbi:sigma-70 family RNA polymerase sigma factor [Solihabitans fulvus]|uniref:sigma-70 family RNA polymerase sigma factor n=1 Tax=Solihabitans fulvus TaxID=1892852 RepID=UPI001CB7683C|nr:sigma-70 family RNA polymerase sigma factor [Solihabitans fulvus]
MSTMRHSADALGDSELADAVRAGSSAAYRVLYERHAGAARSFAFSLGNSATEADDLVSEAFAKVLEMLRSGRGPTEGFRPYLLTVVRNVAFQKHRKDGRVSLQEDFQDRPTVGDEGDPSDEVVALAERSLVATAYARLPERWRTVLWHTEIEGQSPAEIAPILGLSANGVSALAYRAREGLRQAYLQLHLTDTTSARCRATVDRLAVWVRGALSKREANQVEAHLDECERCRALTAELSDVNTTLRAVVAPLVLGVGAAGYLATTGPGTATAAAAPVTAGANSATTGIAQWIGVAAAAAGVAGALYLSPVHQSVPAAEAETAIPTTTPAAPPSSNVPTTPNTPTPGAVPTPGRAPTTQAHQPAVPGQPSTSTQPARATTTPDQPSPSAAPTSSAPPTSTTVAASTSRQGVAPTPPTTTPPTTTPPATTTTQPTPVRADTVALSSTVTALGREELTGKLLRRLDITVHGTASSSATGTLTVALPAGVIGIDGSGRCRPAIGSELVCAITVAPGQGSTISMTLVTIPGAAGVARLSATVGTLRASEDVPL